MVSERSFTPACCTGYSGEGALCPEGSGVACTIPEGTGTGKIVSGSWVTDPAVPDGYVRGVGVLGVRMQGALNRSLCVPSAGVSFRSIRRAWVRRIPGRAFAASVFRKYRHFSPRVVCLYCRRVFGLKTGFIGAGRIRVSFPGVLRVCICPVASCPSRIYPPGSCLLRSGRTSCGPVRFGQQVPLLSILLPSAFVLSILLPSTL